MKRGYGYKNKQEEPTVSIKLRKCEKKLNIRFDPW